jgi:hypothetical protein
VLGLSLERVIDESYDAGEVPGLEELVRRGQYSAVHGPENSKGWARVGR